MLRDCNSVWVFGDSHSTPGFCVEPHQSYWGLAATHLKAKTAINFSRPKISFESICHILVGEQNRYDFKNDFFIIGLPPLERITIFDDHKDTALIQNSFNIDTWQYQSSNTMSHHGLINLQYKEVDKLSVLMSDRSWIETQTLRQIFLLTQWLDRCQANYVIVNHSKNLDADNRWGPSQYILDYCLNHHKCCIFENSLYNVNIDKHKPVNFTQYGWLGHHGPDGNKNFFETTIKNKLC